MPRVEDKVLDVTVRVHENNYTTTHIRGTQFGSIYQSDRIDGAPLTPQDAQKEVDRAIKTARKHDAPISIINVGLRDKALRLVLSVRADLERGYISPYDIEEGEPVTLIDNTTPEQVA